MKRSDWVAASTSDSIEARRPSFLALLESVLAVLLYVAVSRRLGNWSHLATAAMIAPFLLLRTPQSEELGVRLFRGWFEAWCRVEKRFDYFGRSILVYSALLTPVVAGICRVIATVFTVARAPMASVSAIGDNWIRIVFCIDVRRVPEILPGASRIAHETGDLDATLGAGRTLFSPLMVSASWSDALKEFYVSAHPRFIAGLWGGSAGHPLRRVAAAGLHWFALAFMVLLYLTLALLMAFFVGPALIYRWSLKGTFPLWLPLLWAASPAGATGHSSRARLDDIRNGALFRMGLWLASMTLAVFAAKLWLFAAFESIREQWARYAPSLLDQLMTPLVLYPWQVASLLNALGAWFLFLWADQAWRHSERASDVVVDRVISRTLVARRFVSLYTGAAIVWIFMRWAHHLPTLRIVPQLLPWSGS